ncbi:MAG: hypothetical protein A3B91_00700 [Candidatus Yanofskybacteria bacterium RIFCSPHIGHO2_02_FULL_41_29]|uniref:Uncharacterized protein n=1 Tax=Candidatus Yanofskybacteria bacterium RIFCSPHIGHO2_01_FULL_41_53 TaxID=1802663 RepID=A0A1F8EJP8_9BACT|nr:MAG: hypothetical protein A2650_00270 [Candidatus Yanofskybacteria bacterium RIFCSPHIGHO2_01_FULL_41_53]OGN12264.1 MAG: hypothetical protein A3B91_00700 [Candidatus Yanofskybacteria bacterium RIFCSPHIGHO2_02_FULL_41_29]OGN18571.1 MAG: hypothetical protein A3F48_03820 [Candidatus Yanofskybacteria bacterium RIFCSPHIGHO2_12_FULL_41_9]OGN23637.1 MAG: hypothetical protein A2916_01615 [Candidatus Yanofskybacteria bacterium RIFCSPLOWO2_01_FULL_41_67]OGN29376.1 MAG: hypothetical protein A3H54_03910 
MGFFLDLYNFKIISLGHSQHLLDLAINREDLLFLGLSTLSGVEAVLNFNDLWLTPNLPRKTPKFLVLCIIHTRQEMTQGAGKVQGY